jgi:RND family efflux transporter MFP subunit
VSSEIEGRVKSAPVKRGDPVIAGETVIAALERTDLAINLRILKAELAAAKARIKEKEAELKRDGLELKRAKNLFKKRVLDRATLDRAAANREVSLSRSLQAKAEVERVMGRMASIRDQLSKTVIRAPLTGFLTEKTVEIGQWVSKGGMVGEVIEIRKVLVRAPVSERQISYVRVGDSARVRFDAIPGRDFTGRIARVIPKADPKSRTFPVEVELDNTIDYIIKVGMFARVFMEYGESVQAVLIPKDAMLIRPRGAAVFVFEKGRVREVIFTPGRGIDSFVEVPEGKLQPGMQVVVHGNERLRNGMKVQLRGQGRGGGKKRRGKGAPASGRPVQGKRQG